MLVAALVWGGHALLETDRGRALVLRALPLYAPKSGLRVSAGRIDGSIFGRMTIHDLALSDPAGVFARVPAAEIDWRPFDLIDNRLTLRSATAAVATLLRRPALRPSGDPNVLPDIDIVVGRLRIDRLVLAPGIAGIERSVVVTAKADLRDGRALIDIAADSAGDTARIRLDSEPARDRFDLTARVAAPAGGIVGRLLGLRETLDLRIDGDGRWSDWRGRLEADLGRARLADVALSATKGRFVVAGTAAPSLVLGGAGARMTAPAMAIRVETIVAGRAATTDFTAAGPALRLAGKGRVDFAAERFDDLTIDARLLRAAAFNPRLAAREMRLGVRIGGSFARPQVDYALTAPAFSWGRTGFEVFRAAGRVDGGTRPLVIPVVATAARLTNVGETVAPLVAGLRISGPLTLVRGQVASNALAVRSSRIAGIAQLRLDTLGGAWTVDFDGRLPAYQVGTIGRADIAARLHAAPDPGGAGSRVTGTVRAEGRRLDSGFFRSVLGGLPVVTTRVDVAPDLSMRFTGTRLAAPALTLVGGGTRALDGTVRLAGAGRSRDYGPASINLAGPLDRPVADIVLERPGYGIGLAAVSAHIDPVADGWSIVARGGSAIGPASARGFVRTASATIDLDAAIAGVTARGTLTPSEAGPFSGRLSLGGTGIGGSVILTAAGTGQRADVAATATQARLATATIARGTLTGTIVSTDDAPRITGRFTVGDLRAPGITITSGSGTIATDAGRGTIALDGRGVAGTPFDASVRATLASDRIDVGATATIGGKRLALDHPARLDRSPDGWRLAPVTVLTSDGRAEVSGIIGDDSEVTARLDALGLSLLGLVDPAYNLSGRVSGTIAAAIPGSGPPTGSVSLRVAGLTRAGLATTSLPVDVAVNALLTPAAASARAVIARGSATLGRVQAQLTLAPGPNLGDRLLAAPLFAQARYNGPAQAIWLLGGVEAIDVRGPVAAAIDVGGRLRDPILTGTLTASNARVENAALGTIVDNVRLDSRFAGSRLVLTGFAGTIGKAGKVAGSGAIDLSAERQFPIDIRLDLDDAQLLDRDDLRATATGRVVVRSEGGAGRISGALAISRARFRLGRGTATDIPALAVSERNVELLGRATPRSTTPTLWRLDVAATARDNVAVTGLGLDSVWRGNLQITGRATAPELTGRVRVVRGDYDFAGKRFSLTRGELRFAGAADPVIDITAENTSSGFTAQLTLTGTASRPEIKFGSVPALPEDEVLARVLFGTSITALSAPEAVQLAGALASLRGGKAGALNPIEAVRKGLRIDRLRILPADIATGRKTSIAAGQYIGRRLYVELSTDAQGYSASAIEIALTRSLSILSDVATLGGTSVNLRLKKDY